MMMSNARHFLRGHNAMSERIILYGHPFCAMVGPVRGMLERAGVEFEYIDIHQDSAARQRVRAINNGYDSVPTLVFADGSTLTEPSGSALKARLESLGYSVPLSALLLSNLPGMIVLAVALFLLLRALGII